MNEKARKLYEMSLEQSRNEKYNGLNPRFGILVMRSAAEKGFDVVNDGGTLDKHKVWKLVVSGKIWELRNVGKTTVRALCEWIESEQTL